MRGGKCFGYRLKHCFFKMNDFTSNPATCCFQFPIRIYWEDTDAGGIVYHAQYLHFFERARTEWLRQLRIEQQSLNAATGGMFVVQSLQLRYAAPAYLDDWLVTRTTLVQLGKASCTMRQTAHRGDTLLADFTIRLGFVNSTSAAPMRLPALVYDALQPLLIIEKPL
jgi:acyl-CoA thioester hydrolase